MWVLCGANHVRHEPAEQTHFSGLVVEAVVKDEHVIVGGNLGHFRHVFQGSVHGVVANFGTTGGGCFIMRTTRRRRTTTIIRRFLLHYRQFHRVVESVAPPRFLRIVPVLAKNDLPVNDGIAASVQFALESGKGLSRHGIALKGQRPVLLPENFEDAADVAGRCCC